MAWVDQECASDLQVIGAVLGNKPSIERYEKVKVVPGKVLFFGIVSVDETDLRVCGRTGVLRDDFEHSVSVFEELGCSFVWVEIRDVREYERW